MSLEALAMGEYGVYVWGSFGVALAIHLWNLVAPRRRRRELIDALRDGDEA